jgi:hypothetical protein
VASATAFSGYTSGRVINSTTTSGLFQCLDFNLLAFGNRKRYINAAIVTSTTSTWVSVVGELFKGDAAPPSATGHTTYTAVGF